jgi:hypothetical protein
MIDRPLLLVLMLTFTAASHSIAQGRAGTIIPEADILKVRVRFDSSVDRFTGRPLVGSRDIKTLAGGNALGLSDVSLVPVYAIPPDAPTLFLSPNCL